MVTIDKDVFFSNLKITQEYCEQQLQKSEKSKHLVLRNCPVFNNDTSYANWEEWSEKADPYNADVFSELFNAQLAYKQNFVGGLESIVEYQGKILVVEYGLNIPDGVVEIETGGFFDGFDLPPVDTWFYNGYNDFREGILFAWIPEQFVKLADEAVGIQFLDILHWFNKSTC